MSRFNRKNAQLFAKTAQDGSIELGFTRQKPLQVVGESITIPPSYPQNIKPFHRSMHMPSTEYPSPPDSESPLNSPEPPSRSESKSKEKPLTTRSKRPTKSQSTQQNTNIRKSRTVNTDTTHRSIDDTDVNSSQFDPIASNQKNSRKRHYSDANDEENDQYNLPPTSKRRAGSTKEINSPEPDSDHFVQLNSMIKELTNKTNNKNRKRIEEAVDRGISDIEAVLDRSMEQEVAFVSKIHEKKMDGLKNLHSTVVAWSKQVREANRQYTSELKRLSSDLNEITSAASETIEDINKSHGTNISSHLKTQATRKDFHAVFDSLKEKIHLITKEKDTSTLDALKTMLTLFQ